MQHDENTPQNCIPNNIYDNCLMSKGMENVAFSCVCVWICIQFKSSTTMVFEHQTYCGVNLSNCISMFRILNSQHVRMLDKLKTDDQQPLSTFYQIDFYSIYTCKYADHFWCNFDVFTFIYSELLVDIEFFEDLLQRCFIFLVGLVYRFALHH